MEEKLIYEVHDRVARITINRERRRNALDDDTLRRLRDALEECGSSDVGAIVMRGAGTKAFSAGSDIKELAQQTQAQKIAHTELGQAIADMIEQHPCPVIVAIEGYCLGGGLEMAMACDYRIAGAGSTLGLPEVALNALPSWGGTVRLPRLIGVGRAREIILFGRQLNAEEALNWGLVNQVVPQGAAFDAALAFANDFVAKTDRGTVAIAKGLVTHGVAAPSRTGRYLELLADMTVLASEAMQSGLTRFVEKSKTD